MHNLSGKKGLPLKTEKHINYLKIKKPTIKPFWLVLWVMLNGTPERSGRTPALPYPL